jgi:hypothetical protein
MNVFVSNKFWGFLVFVVPLKQNLFHRYYADLIVMSSKFSRISVSNLCRYLVFMPAYINIYSLFYGSTSFQLFSARARLKVEMSIFSSYLRGISFFLSWPHTTSLTVVERPTRRNHNYFLFLTFLPGSGIKHLIRSHFHIINRNWATISALRIFTKINTVVKMYLNWINKN